MRAAIASFAGSALVDAAPKVKPGVAGALFGGEADDASCRFFILSFMASASVPVGAVELLLPKVKPPPVGLGVASVLPKLKPVVAAGAGGCDALLAGVGSGEANPPAAGLAGSAVVVESPKANPAPDEDEDGCGTGRFGVAFASLESPKVKPALV